MRVESRRLRVAMDDFAGTLPKKGYRKLLRRVHNLTDALGTVRDIDIFIRSLSRSQAELPRSLRTGVTPLIRHCREERNRKHRDLQDFFHGLEEFGFEEKFRGWLSD